MSVDALASAPLIERLAEGAVLISLFTTGLKLRLPLNDPRWWTPLRLAFISMAITVGFVTFAGMAWFGLPLGAAVLLGAILAPTDPVLASEVQLADVRDRDRLRFSLSGEAGLNDGTAFPFVMLGLGLLGLHELGAGGWRWWAVDVAWGVCAGLAIGAGCGVLVARLILWLRREHREGIGRDEFLALGLIALSYGAALLAHTYGFLAVFAAGVAVRVVERRHSGDRVTGEVLTMESAGHRDEIALDREKAPAHMAGRVLEFNEQIEGIVQVALVFVIGAMLSRGLMRFEYFAFIAALFFVIRPVSVQLGLLGSTNIDAGRRGFIAWFGIRGIGSLYYLAYAVNPAPRNCRTSRAAGSRDDNRVHRRSRNHGHAADELVSPTIRRTRWRSRRVTNRVGVEERSESMRDDALRHGQTSRRRASLRFIEAPSRKIVWT